MSPIFTGRDCGRLQPHPINSFVIERLHGLLILFLGILIAGPASAQQVQVKVRVASEKGAVLPFASVQVLLLPDSSQNLVKATDPKGMATFLLNKGSRYLLRATHAGYDSAQKETGPITDTLTIQLSLESLGRTLTGVTVTAAKPVMRQEEDKTIVDPENLAASSTNAYEIIEKTPGLFVDQDGNIYLSSTTPATIYINGREQKMSTADIATLLKSLPPNAIASIEILRTPSARYDASGGGGIVNIVLKKGVRLGLTGSIHAGMNQGRYGNRFLGFTLNNSKNALTTYLNFQYTRKNSYEEIKTDRLFAMDSLLSQDALTKYPGDTWFLGLGLGYQLNRKWELSYDGRFTYNHSKTSSSNLSDILNANTGKVGVENISEVRNRTNATNTTQGLSAKFKMDSTGSEWTTDLSFSYAPGLTHQLFRTTYTLPLQAAGGGDGTIDNDLRLFSAQTNVLKKLKRKFTVEGGLKTTAVWFTNSTDYFRLASGSRTKDEVRTGAYRYRENIHAAYLQVSKTIASITVKGGTRLENTQMQGHQLQPADTTFTLRRTDLFPYLFISRDLAKIAGYSLRAYLVYRRTINRPAYEYLNPSLRFVDQYLYETGNPSLRPQFTQNYEANISVEERPIFALGLNNTKDIFTNVVYQADSSHSVAYRTYDNLGSNKEMYFRILGALPPGKKYFFVAGAQYNHNFYRGLYENKPLDFKKGSWTFFTYHSLRLFPNTQFTLNGFARFNGQLQFYELSSFGSLNASINRQFLNKKLMISLSGSDLFFTNNNHFTIRQGSVNASGFRKGDTRRMGLNIRYNFGLRKKEENNPFNMESPEKTN